MNKNNDLYDAVIGLIKESDKTKNDIIKALGMSYNDVANVIRNLKRHEKIHVTCWKFHYSRLLAVYRFGPGKNVYRPNKDDPNYPRIANTTRIKAIKPVKPTASDIVFDKFCDLAKVWDAATRHAVMCRA